MTRNIENLEVACPIYDKDLQKQIIDTFEIAWNDNVKGRYINQVPKRYETHRRYKSSFSMGYLSIL